MVTKLTQKVSFFFFKVLKLGPAMNLRQLNSSEALSVSKLSFLISTARYGKNSSWVCKTTPIIQMGQTLTNEQGKRINCFPPTLFSNTVS